MWTHFANLYMLIAWGPHTVYHRESGTLYIFYIYMTKCGWLSFMCVQI